MLDDRKNKNNEIFSLKAVVGNGRVIPLNQRVSIYHMYVHSILEICLRFRQLKCNMDMKRNYKIFNECVSLTRPGKQMSLHIRRRFTLYSSHFRYALCYCCLARYDPADRYYLFSIVNA